MLSARCVRFRPHNRCARSLKLAALAWLQPYSWLNDARACSQRLWRALYVFHHDARRAILAAISGVLQKRAELAACKTLAAQAFLVDDDCVWRTRSTVVL